MASYDFTNGSIDGQMVPRKTTPEENTVFVRRNIVDFSKQNLASGDDAKALDIEEGLIVRTVIARVITADSGGGTIAIGDSASDTSWGSATAPSTEGAVLGGTVDYTYFDSDGGVYLTAGGTANLTTAKVEVLAECVKALDKI